MQSIWVLVQVGNDNETRKRRACQEAEEEDSQPSEDEEDRLAGLLRTEEGDSEDEGLDEHDKQQLLKAHALKANVTKPAFFDASGCAVLMLCTVESCRMSFSQLVMMH